MKFSTKARPHDHPFSHHLSRFAGSDHFAGFIPAHSGTGLDRFDLNGKCYGFTDGVSNCTWQEYATTQIFWSALLVISPGLILAANWLTTLGFWWNKRRTASPERLPLSQVILIPVVACIGGFCLISALPVVINVFGKFIR